MKTLPLPPLKTDREADEFYNTGKIAIADTKNAYDALEGVDRLLAPLGYEIVSYDGTSDFIFSIASLGSGEGRG